MKNAIVAGLLLATVLLSGCVPFSLHPIYTDETLIFEPALLGTWAESKDSVVTYSFLKNDDEGYKMIVTEENEEPMYFETYLADIDGTIFLDVFPDLEAMDTSFINSHLMPVHSFYVIEQFDPTLKIAPIDVEWLATYLEEHPAAIDFSIHEDSVIFTSSTDKLQAFLRKILKDDAIICDTVELERSTEVRF